MQRMLFTTLWSNGRGNISIDFWLNTDGTYDVIKTHLISGVVETIASDVDKTTVWVIFKSFIKKGFIEDRICQRVIY
jgi:hypothetical protein